jgi:hypothetical protein
MKRELVVFSVIGGLLWVATGLSVLAITIFDSDGDPMGSRTSVVGNFDPGTTFFGDRSRDAETSAPLCETRSSDESQPRTRQESDLRSTEVDCTIGDSVRCWHNKAVSLLHYCLLLT